MRKFFVAFVAMTVFSTLLAAGPVEAQTADNVCPPGAVDSDGDGWGWIEATRTSCAMPTETADPAPVTTPPPDAPNPDDDSFCPPDAVDSDGDGWGWIEATGTSCEMPPDPTGAAPPTNTGPPTDTSPPTNTVGVYEYVAVGLSAAVINAEQRIKIDSGNCYAQLGNVDRRVEIAEIEDYTQLDWPGCDELEALLLSTAALEPMVLSDPFVHSDQVAFNWSSVRAADGYIVSRLPKTQTSEVVRVDAPGTAFFATDLEPDTTYSFEFAATRDGETGPPTVIEVTTDPDRNTQFPPVPDDYDPLTDPNLGPIDVVVSATEDSVTLSWTDWAATVADPPDGYQVSAVPYNMFGTKYLVADETTYTDIGIGLVNGGTLDPGMDRAYNVRAYRQQADGRVFGPETLIETSTLGDGATAPTNMVAALIVTNPATEEVTVDAAWLAPEQFDSVDGYEISNGIWSTEIPVDQIERYEEAFTYKYVIDPTDAGPAEQVWYDEIVNNRSFVQVRAYSDGTSGRRTGAWARTSTLTFSVGPVFVSPPGEPGRPLELLVDRLMPNLSDDRRTELLNLIWEVHHRELQGLDDNYAKSSYLVEQLNIEGVAIDLDDLQDGSFVLRGISNTELLRQLVNLAPAQELDEIVRGFGPSGSGLIESIRLRLRDLGPEGRVDRAAQYGANLEVFQDALTRLQDDGGLAELREVFALAEEQATILLNVEQVQGGELRYAQRTITDQESAGSGVFAALWADASRDERIAYWGFDGFGYELAAPYIDVAEQTERNIDKMTSRTRRFVSIFITVVASIALAQVGVAGAEFLNLTGATATIAGGAFGAYATVIFLGGSTADAERAAWRKLLTGGLDHLTTSIPVDQRTFSDTATIILLEAGLESVVDGTDFGEALLKAIGRNYIPGLEEFFAEGSVAEQVAGEFGTVLILSYIQHGPDWDLILADLEAYGLALFGDWVGAEIADLLPEGDGWDSIGNDLAEIISVAVVTGNDGEEVRAAIITAVGNRAGTLVGQSVGNVFGDDDGWQAQLATDLTDMYFDVLATTPSDQVGAEFDRRLGRYLLGLAGDWAGEQLRTALTQANGGQSAGWIDFTSGLLTVAIANGDLNSDQLEAVLRNYVTQYLTTFLTDLTPGCLPPWVDDAVSTVVGSIGNGESMDQALTNLENFAQATSNSGGFDDLGTCGSTNPGGEPGDSGSCTYNEPIPLSAPTGTETCAEDGTKIYMHPIGLWAVVGTNEIRDRDNDGMLDDPANGEVVEVPASAAPFPHPVVALVWALGSAVVLTMQSSGSDDVVLTDGSRATRYSDLDDAWARFPDSYFEDMSSEKIDNTFSRRSGDDTYEEYYQIGAIRPRIRLAVRDDDTAILQIRHGFFDWFTTDRQFWVSRGGASGTEIVSFDAVDNSPQGLENRTAGLPTALTTTSTRARAELNAENRDGEWQAHHLVPVNVIIYYQDMFVEAVEHGLSEDSAILTRGLYLTDAVNNLILLPANVDTQRSHYLETQQCLPIHNGYSRKHQRWDHAAEFGFTGPVGNEVSGVAELHHFWSETAPPAPPAFWTAWSLDVLDLQVNMRERIKNDTFGEPGCN